MRFGLMEDRLSSLSEFDREFGREYGREFDREFGSEFGRKFGIMGFAAMMVFDRDVLLGEKEHLFRRTVL